MGAKYAALLLLTLGGAALAATPDLIQTCTSLPTVAPAGALVGCPTTNVTWGPKLTTDLVRIQQASSSYAQKWVAYSSITAADKVVRKSTGAWDTFSNVAVTPAPTPPPPQTTPTVAAVALTWVAPTQNTDGSALTDLASYNIYQGTTADNLAKVGSIPNPAKGYTTPNLAPGTYYFAVSAVNAGGVESARSGVAMTVLTPPPAKVPGSPSSLKVTVNIIAGP